MKNFSLIFSFTVFFYALLSFSTKPAHQDKGHIEGYVVPKNVESWVELIIKKAGSETDTTMLRTTTDEKGFYRFEGLDDGVYELLIWPKSGDYISKKVSRVVNTKARKASAEKADSIILERSM